MIEAGISKELVGMILNILGVGETLLVLVNT